MGDHYFTGQVFNCEDFDKFKPVSNGDFEACTFEECTFEGIDFFEYSFKSWRFTECVFRGCSLREIDLVNSSFRETNFLRYRLLGLNWASVKSLAELSFE